MKRSSRVEKSATKRFGQNFLVDKNIVDKEVRESGVSDKDIVLEIGPGHGALTRKLASSAKKVYAVELDKKMIESLRCGLEGIDNVEIIEGDFLKTKVPDFDMCVSNIPYNISSGVIEVLGGLGKGGVLIVQKEFCERLVACPGSKNYSRISVLSKFYFNISLISYIHPRCFRPIPKVYSAMIRLVPIERDYNDRDGFFRFIRGIFNHRRKTLAASVKCSGRELGLSKERLREISEKIKFRDERVFCMDIDMLFEVYDDYRKLL